MRLLVILLLFILFTGKEENTLSGIVRLKDDTIPGAHIQILNTPYGTGTDSDGHFRVFVDTATKVDIEVSYPDHPTTVIRKVAVHEGAKEIVVPIFQNTFISEEGYLLLDKSRKKLYKELRCYGALLGYFNTQEIDTSTIISCNGEIFTYFTHDISQNSIIIDYETLTTCY